MHPVDEYVICHRVSWILLECINASQQYPWYTTLYTFPWPTHLLLASIFFKCLCLMFYILCPFLTSLAVTFSSSREFHLSTFFVSLSLGWSCVSMSPSDLKKPKIRNIPGGDIKNQAEYLTTIKKFRHLFLHFKYIPQRWIWGWSLHCQKQNKMKLKWTKITPKLQYNRPQNDSIRRKTQVEHLKKKYHSKKSYQSKRDKSKHLIIELMKKIIWSKNDRKYWFLKKNRNYVSKQKIHGTMRSMRKYKHYGT